MQQTDILSERTVNLQNRIGLLVLVLDDEISKCYKTECEREKCITNILIIFLVGNGFPTLGIHGDWCVAQH